jgi:two-component system phosphate regulon response regulator PhoB
VLSERTGEYDEVAALEGGAEHHASKPYSVRELLARIKAVIRSRMPRLADEVVEIGGLRLDPAARLVRAGDREIDLWTTEFRLLHLFMTHTGRPFSRTRLIDEIWGHDAFVEERIVDVHIRRLRQGLAPTGHDVLLETAPGGYCFRTGRSTGQC